ncbi:hypothetical protein Tco_0924842, partial [Tanacetum coccineum]
VYGGPHYSSVCDPNPCNNYDLPYFDQPHQYHIDQSPPQDLEFERLSKIKIDRLWEDVLSTQIPNLPIDLDTEESDDDIEVTLDKEQFLRERNTAHITPHAYTPSLPFLTTMEPADILSMGVEVISTTLARENDELIKSSVDDLVPIPRESEVTSDSNLECDMPVNTPLPTTDVREENFDINSPLGEYVVDFLMENEDIADLPRHLEFEDISSLDPPESTLVIDESTLLVTPPPASKQFSLREVERFDPFFSLTQSGGKTRVMETPSFGFHHMPSPRPAAYSPKEVMYRYYHPHLTSGDGFDPEIKKIPSDENKVHIEVLSVLWGNRLLIPDGSLPLSRCTGLKTMQKQ